MKQQADSDLMTVLPRLVEAEKRLEAVAMTHFGEVRGITKPSASLVRIWEVACILLGVPPIKTNE